MSATPTAPSPAKAAQAAVLRDAEFPFNDDDADIILRSSDDVDFRVHKLILSKTSALFEGMFTLPLPTGYPNSLISPLHDGDETKGGLVVIRMVEAERALDILLRFCYPTDSPPLDTFDDVRTALHLARKFDIGFIKRAASKRLHRHAATAPERTYATAVAYGCKEVALAAARGTLRRPGLQGERLPEFSEISGSALYSLIDYQRKCRDAVGSVAEDIGWLYTGKIPSLVFGMCDNCNPTTGYAINRPGRRELSFKGWFWEYVLSAALALHATPCEATVENPELVVAAVREAAKCNICWAEDIITVMERCTKALAAEVGRKLSSIPLNFEG